MNYTFEPIKYDINSLQNYASFLNSIFHEKILKTAKFLDWEYNRNPIGKAYGYDALFDGKLVAHYSAQPIKCMINNVLRKGILALHVATDSLHQGKGLFKIINNKAHEKAKTEGVEFIIGVANRNSAPRYEKSLGFQIVSPLDARIGFGIPDFIEGNVINFVFKRVWDVTTLQWRLQDPSYKYEYYRTGDQIFIIAPTHISSIKAIIYHFKLGDYSSIILPEHLKSKNSVFVWLGKDSRLQWKLSMNLPMSLRPSPLNMIYMDLLNPKKKIRHK